MGLPHFYCTRVVASNTLDDGIFFNHPIRPVRRLSDGLLFLKKRADGI